MAEESTENLPVVPLWKRIARFPLVALVLALAGMLLGLVGASYVLSAIGVGGSGGGTVPNWSRSATITAATIAAVLAIYKLWVTRLGETTRDDLPFDRRFADAGTGTLIAIALISAVVGIAALLGGYRIAGWGGSGSLPLFLLQAGLQAALVEEIIIRGILFRWLEGFGGSWFALALSSAFFGFAHLGNPNATVFSSVAIAIEAGILLGGAYMLTRNLWLAVGIHFGWNFAQGYLWDVPVSGFGGDGLLDAHPAGDALISGGQFGLEASLPALILATALGGWLLVLAARRGHFMRPWWVRRRMAKDAAPVAS